MGLWFLFGCVLSIFAVDASIPSSWEVSRQFWMAQQAHDCLHCVVFCYVFIMKRLDEGYARCLQ